MPSRAGLTRPPARARRSSTGSLRRRHSSPGAERRGLRAVARREDLDFDRPPPVNGDIALGHVTRAEALTGDGTAANSVDLIETVGALHQVVGVLRQEARDAFLDQ